MQAFGLSEKNINRFIDVFKKFPHIDHVDLFGSRARGTFRSGSDIDLAVYGRPDIQGFEFSNLSMEIDALPIAFKIDLVDMNRLSNEKLAASIRRDGVRFYPPKVSDHPIQSTSL